jgi:hypothetical protein
MTTGALIFAVNSSHCDYVRMATWQAHRIKRWLGLPVCLVTDQQIHDPVWDRVVTLSGNSNTTTRWFADVNAAVSWNNHDRCDALHITPYDRTLLLDADYVISSDTLLAVINNGSDMFCFHKCHDATSGLVSPSLNEFGSYRMPMLWCTVLCFSKNYHSKLVFDCWRMIRDNWNHYRELYGITERLFRNDYALTIAMHIVNGHHVSQHNFYSSMCAVMPTVRLQQGQHADEFRIEYIDNTNRPKYQIFHNQDFHAMGKQHLQELIRA